MMNGLKDRHEVQRGRTGRLYVYLTSLCNQRCAFCASDYVYQCVERTVTFIEFVDFLGRYGERAKSLTISGGEPTCVDELPRYIVAACEYGLDVVLQTNALRLADVSYCERLISSGIGTFSVPFFASNADSFGRLTGATKQSFSQYIAGMQCLNSYAGEGKVRFSLKVLGLAGYLGEVRVVRQFLATNEIWPNSICLNGLHYGMSIRDSPFLWPSLRELGETYSSIIKDFDNTLPISCVEMPLCILTDSALLMMLQQASFSRTPQVVVMLNLHGETSVLEDGSYKPESCSRCYIASLCGGMNGKNHQLFSDNAMQYITPIILA